MLINFKFHTSDKFKKGQNMTLSAPGPSKNEHRIC
jgi:hypothetical protein